MIVPLAPFAIRGVIWYQGEGNAGRAYQYRKLLPAMIKCWRDLWGQGDFPFLIVSLANFKAAPDVPGDSDWAELREAQAMTAAQPHNGLAIPSTWATPMTTIPRTSIRSANADAPGAQSGLRSRISLPPPRVRFHAIECHKVRVQFRNAEGGCTKRAEPVGFQVGVRTTSALGLRGD
jgi:sialate O-acetylesterase